MVPFMTAFSLASTFLALGAGLMVLHHLMKHQLMKNQQPLLLAPVKIPQGPRRPKACT